MGDFRTRTNRHRPQLEPAPAPARDTLAAPPAPPAPRKRPPAAPAVHDQTPGATRRPAQLSDRCSGCGAPTAGRARMVTELVRVGPVRALRVVACSACPDRRRRDALV